MENERNTMSAEDFEEAKILDFTRKATQPSFTETNWLMNLPVDTIFLAKNTDPRQRTFILAEYILKEKTQKSAKLCMQENDNQLYLWVDPNTFCLTWSLFEVLE
jgi:hypothetical protein